MRTLGTIHKPGNGPSPDTESAAPWPWTSSPQSRGTEISLSCSICCESPNRPGQRLQGFCSQLLPTSPNSLRPLCGSYQPNNVHSQLSSCFSSAKFLPRSRSCMSFSLLLESLSTVCAHSFLRSQGPVLPAETSRAPRSSSCRNLRGLTEPSSQMQLTP